jgi:ribonucrease Y
MDILINIALFLVGAVVTYFYFSSKPKTETKVDGAELKKILAEKTAEIKTEKQTQLDEYKKDLAERFKEKESSLQEVVEQKNKLQLEQMQLDLQKKVQKEEEEARKKSLDLQVELNKKQDDLNLKLEEINNQKTKLEEERGKILELEKEVHAKQSTLDGEYSEKLAKLAKLTKEEARKQLMERVEEETGEDLLLWQKKYLEKTKDDANKEARNIVSLAIQRVSSEVANEATVTAIKLTNNEDKGKIIGKAGRNIQWLEKTLGVEIIIDDTPDMVSISGFNSIRRHLAMRTLEMLLADGRLHPSAIEEKYEKAKKEISEDITRAGHEAVESLGIYDFPEKLIRIIGRLRFRTSYGQNILRHSIEMARIAALLAKEMNEKFPHREPIDEEIVKKGALLHDIGKALDEEGEVKGDHVLLGAKVAETFGLDWRIKKCITAHHDESYTDEKNGFSIEAVLVDACDNISGGRPGARKESVEAYFQRIEAMEKIAEETQGVEKAWIMRGARELWVFFDTKQVTPAKMQTMTKDIVHRIQTGVRYPGEIKVIGMWEDKVVEYAS